ncbi:hypothetical protein D5086_030077 [Populus alba]|uniref:Uncharacterized protein n=1 Tax=Populus alba TaxID=43335 RepID=A0ACC4AN95_POPAL
MILSFSNPHLVAAAVALAAVEVVAAEADVAGTAAAAAAVAAASGNEFGAVETVVQLRKYALLDYWGVLNSYASTKCLTSLTNEEMLIFGMPTQS